MSALSSGALGERSLQSEKNSDDALCSQSLVPRLPLQLMFGLNTVWNCDSVSTEKHSRCMQIENYCVPVGAINLGLRFPRNNIARGAGQANASHPSAFGKETRKQ